MINKFLALIAFIFVFNFSPLFSQELPPFTVPFLQDEVADIYIIIHPDSLAAILHPDSLSNNHEFPSTFIYSASGIQDTIYDIGFRLRGNTSRQSAKKSFKISFNSFIPGNKYHGLEKMNLNGSSSDPSNIRVKLYWDALREVGLRGSRTSHVNLYINGEFKGVYTHVEHIDEEFCDTHFENGDGNLWKCLYPGDLAYLGNSPEDYKLEVFGRRVYELKTNNAADDYSALAEFIGLINNAPPSTLVCSLAPKFDINEYLRYAAIDVLFGNWDGYSFNMNNYYLYEDPSTHQVHYMAYDLDNVLGIDWFGIDWTERDPYDWSPGEGSRPLYDVIMAVPEWRNAFTQYLDEYSQKFIADEWIANRASDLVDVISSDMANDTYYPQDWGYDFTSFQESLNSAAGNHVQYGIIPYLERRLDFLDDQIETYSASPLIDWVDDNSPIVNEEIVTVTVHISGAADQVNLAYTVNDGLEELAAMTEVSEGIWNIDLAIQDGQDKLEYQVRAYFEGAEFNHRCTPQLIWLSPGNSGLVINELMSLNTNTIQDETGAFADWLELYNSGSSPVNLNSIYLTDKPSEPWRWNIPAVTMEADSYRLIWADSDPEDGVFHTNFNLDSEGEGLAMYSFQNSAWRLLDYVDFGVIPADQSLARICDGDDNWQLDESSSPSVSNCLVGISDLDRENSITAYPNPSNGQFSLSEKCSGKIYNLGGRLVNQFNTTNNLNLSGMESGLYLVVLDNNSRFKLVLE